MSFDSQPAKWTRRAARAAGLSSAPMLLLVEDLQWADAALVEALLSTGADRNRPAARLGADLSAGSRAPPPAFNAP